MRIHEGEIGQAQHHLRATLNRVERSYMENVRRDMNITNVLRGPQGRLYLDIQVISNFYEIIE